MKLLEDKRKRGRPSDYRSEYAEQAEKLCKLGATDLEIANFFEVTESTFYLWKKEHPEFSEALKNGKEIADGNVASRLYSRAMGYEAEEDHVTNYQGQICITRIKKYYPPDTVACIFWLKNRRPDKWRDKTEKEIIRRNAPEDMSDDELTRIAKRGSDGASEKKKGKEKSSSVH